MDFVSHDYWMGIPPNDEDNVVAALEHPDRVSYLGLSITGSQLDMIATMMQEPFPVLTSLYIHLDNEDDAPVLPRVLPAEFLGGSAPRLQFIELDSIPFPELPTFLLSTSDLVWLRLFNIPLAGYMAPEAMVSCLALLPRLKSFIVEFRSAISRPDRTSPPPVTRTVLLALTFFKFEGVSEYLEDLVAQIDSPQLDQIRIDYLNQFADLQVAQLSKFIDRSVGHKSALLRHARVIFFSGCVSFEMGHHEIRPTPYLRHISTSILFQGVDRQVFQMTQVLNQVSAALSNVVHLNLAVVDTYPEQLEGTDNVEWRDLLHQFSNVQTLHISEELTGRAALALDDITGEMAAEPASSIGNFIAARRLSDRPITVVDTKMEFDERLESYVSEDGGPFSILSDSPSGATSHIRQIAQGRRKEQMSVRVQGESDRHDMTINTLPDDVLLEIFDFCREGYSPFGAIDCVWEWHFFVHVCRRWRQIIFDSPLRLNVRIHCTHGTPVRKNLGIWPTFPIVISYDYGNSIPPNDDEDNVVAALEHPDRVSYLGLSVMTGSQLHKISAVIQKPFPVLVGLQIHSENVNAPVLPAAFLGRSALRLQYFELQGIPFLALPTLLLSAINLVYLRILNIPPTGYIAPNAMVVGLAALLRLESIVIEFQSAIPHPDRISPPPVTRTVLPALTSFEFNGASEYLEDLVARIDSPQLDRIRIDYFNPFVDFQVGQLSKFIDRSVGTKLILRYARVTFFSRYVSFETGRHKIRKISYPQRVSTSILCQWIDWQVSHMAQVLSHNSVTFSNVVHLKLAVLDNYPEQLEGTGDIAWPYLFHQFSNVQTLHVSRVLAGHVAAALEDITGEMAAEVFPSLDLIYLAGHPTSTIRNFIAARQLSDRPITVVNTKTEFNERLESYVSE
ncbi:hypothetical protein EDB86DRAFT_3107855 [Lactarius hatsudake]|nr:hypothetical protein EDB86DRAFT_3107855 [Lactarius hatsudake]